MNRTHIKWFPIGIAIVLFAWQYFSSEKFVNPETGRKSHVGMSTEQEAALGFQSYRQVLAKSHAIDSGPQLEMVKRVAGRLASATGKAGAGYDWQVSLIQDNQVNAFCLPGGKIVVYTGIIPVAQNEAALATVMGHENGARHFAPRRTTRAAAKSRANGDDRHRGFAVRHGLQQTARGDGSARRRRAIRDFDAIRARA